MKLNYFLSVFAIVAILASCSKGDTGPQGPQGEQGPNGNANVTVTTYTIQPGQGTGRWTWSSGGIFGSGGWYANLTPDTGVNPTHGAITILFSVDQVNWSGLPAIGTFLITANSAAANIDFTVSSSQIQIQYVPEPGAANPLANCPGFLVYVKVAIIPPSIMVKNPNTNWQNAMEVSQLPEVNAAMQHAQSGKNQLR